MQRNDKLTEENGSYAEVVDRYKESRKIDKTGVWITYPYLEIAGNAEMTQNANAVISEAVEKIEVRAYKNSDENVILRVDYMMNYVSSKLISISFIEDVTGDSKKEDIVEECSIVGGDPANIDAHLDDFDTNWDQYSIASMKYYLYVPALDENDGLVVDGNNVVHVFKNEKFLSQNGKRRL